MTPLSRSRKDFLEADISSDPGGEERSLRQGFFLDILKKTQARKNSKLKQFLMKTQAKFQKNSKTANWTWAFIIQKLHFLSENVPYFSTYHILDNLFWVETHIILRESISNEINV